MRVIACLLLALLAFPAWTAPQATPPMRFDFDGDGRDDLLLVGEGGAVWMQLGASTERLAVAPAGPAYVKLVGDLDGDGRSDLLWEAPDGSSFATLMSGAATLSRATLLPAGTGWSARLLADIDGDGRADIVWTHADGSVAMWLMEGLQQRGGARWLAGGTGWNLAAVADFDGDGHADLAWSHADGSAAMWLMKAGRQVGGARLLPAGTGWTPRLAGDIDGDGKADLFWEDASGQAAVWLMDGARQVGGARLGAAGGALIAAIDFDHDGKVDLISSRVALSGPVIVVDLMDGLVRKGGFMRLAGAPRQARYVGDRSGGGMAELVVQNMEANDGFVRVSNFMTGTPYLLPRFVVTELPGLGGDGAAVSAVNESGMAVGNAKLPGGERRAVAWKDGAVSDLGSGSANAVNARGTIAGVSPSDEVVLWRDGALLRTGIQGIPYDINDDDMVVGLRYGAGQSFSAFLWQEGVVTDLGSAVGLPAGSRSLASGINRAGQVVVRFEILDPSGLPVDSSSRLYDHGAVRDIPAAGMAFVGFDINDRGQVSGNAAPAHCGGILDLATGTAVRGGPCDGGYGRINNAGDVTGVTNGTTAYVKYADLGPVYMGTVIGDLLAPGTIVRTAPGGLNDRGWFGVDLSNVTPNRAFLVRRTDTR